MQTNNSTKQFKIQAASNRLHSGSAKSFSVLAYCPAPLQYPWKPTGKAFGTYAEAVAFVESEQRN